MILCPVVAEYASVFINCNRIVICAAECAVRFNFRRPPASNPIIVKVNWIEIDRLIRTTGQYFPNGWNFDLRRVCIDIVNSGEKAIVSTFDCSSIIRGQIDPAAIVPRDRIALLWLGERLLTVSVAIVIWLSKLIFDIGYNVLDRNYTTTFSRFSFTRLLAH